MISEFFWLILVLSLSLSLCVKRTHNTKRERDWNPETRSGQIESFNKFRKKRFAFPFFISQLSLLESNHNHISLITISLFHFSKL